MSERAAKRMYYAGPGVFRGLSCVVVALLCIGCHGGTEDTGGDTGAEMVGPDWMHTAVLCARMEQEASQACGADPASCFEVACGSHPVTPYAECTDRPSVIVNAATLDWAEGVCWDYPVSHWEDTFCTDESESLTQMVFCMYEGYE